MHKIKTFLQRQSCVELFLDTRLQKGKEIGLNIHGGPLLGLITRWFYFTTVIKKCFSMKDVGVRGNYRPHSIPNVEWMFLVGVIIIKLTWLSSYFFSTKRPFFLSDEAKGRTVWGSCTDGGTGGWGGHCANRTWPWRRTCSRGTLKRQDRVVLCLASSVNTSLVSVLGLTQLDLSLFLSRPQVIKSFNSVSQRAALLINASCGSRSQMEMGLQPFLFGTLVQTAGPVTSCYADRPVAQFPHNQMINGAQMGRSIC